MQSKPVSETAGDQAAAVLNTAILRPIELQSAFDETVERLSQVVRLGGIEPGMPLPPERELISRLRISRTTLREAIRVLQREGLLETRRGRSGGTFVTGVQGERMSKSQARQLARRMGDSLIDALDFRAAVEPKAAELAAVRADHKTVQCLRALLRNWESAGADENRTADAALHIAIAQASGSAYILDAVLDLQTRFHELFRCLALMPTARVGARTSSREHERIVLAIAQGDARGAREAMKEHISGGEELVFEVLESPSATPHSDGFARPTSEATS